MPRLIRESRRCPVFTSAVFRTTILRLKHRGAARGSGPRVRRRAIPVGTAGRPSPVRRQRGDGPRRVRTPVLPALPERRSPGFDETDGGPARVPYALGLLGGHQADALGL